MKKLLLTFLCAAMLLSLCACESKTSVKDYNVTKIDGYVLEESETPTNYVRIVMEDGSAMLLELYPDIAPITVQNFKGLVSDKYYDGIVFHRIMSGFMIQGGDPDGDGYSNGDRPTIKGEFAYNGFVNNLSHERGVISMARSTAYNSASTQFFIMHKTNTSLDGQYAAFGKLLAGYDTLDKLAAWKVNGDRAIDPPVMKTVRFVNILSGGEK